MSLSEVFWLAFWISVLGNATVHVTTWALRRFVRPTAPEEKP